MDPMGGHRTQTTMKKPVGFLPSFRVYFSAIYFEGLKPPFFSMGCWGAPSKYLLRFGVLGMFSGGPKYILRFGVWKPSVGG